ncbi:hypothetical protein CYY_009913 [Polysphondylium violaceum]|uniref:Uncharacterized protein n=1 Tax=Polysphondylium violaceum TaxID=133409 RepID=A0A8J4UP64_9MYCE|nr:hypothetical protein CYY_009913 [Polysphondylium violaceum]
MVIPTIKATPMMEPKMMPKRGTDVSALDIVWIGYSDTKEIEFILDDEKANILRSWTLETFDYVIVDDLNYEDKAIHETPRAKFKHSIQLKKGA